MADEQVRLRFAADEHALMEALRTRSPTLVLLPLSWNEIKGRDCFWCWQLQASESPGHAFAESVLAIVLSLVVFGT